VKDITCLNLAIQMIFPVSRVGTVRRCIRGSEIHMFTLPRPVNDTIHRELKVIAWINQNNTMGVLACAHTINVSTPCFDGGCQIVQANSVHRETP